MVTINGEPVAAAGESIAHYLERAGCRREYIVVERKLDIVPKTDYETVMIQDGDTVEIVQFVGGG
ncbi:MAG: sulfur carrier protein ThiS [Clostridiales bacterium]|nr:sulfur carrier protein ThiS [Clostridiales bacterium]